MSKKPYEDLIEQKMIQEIKNTKQHWPCHGGIIKTRNTEDMREFGKRIILKDLEERMSKTISTSCKENDRGVPFMHKNFQVRQGRQIRGSSQDRILIDMILTTGKIVMAHIRYGR